MMNKHIKYLTLLLPAALLLASCGVVTKRYQQPKVEADRLLRDTTVTDTASLANESWQNLFSDPQLQTLIQEGLEHNFDLKSAIEKMKEAKASLTQSKLAYLPNVSANAGVTRNKLSEKATYSTIYYSTTWQAGLSASWELDVWGKLNSTKKAALAAYLQTDAARRAVQTELVASIANYYYTLLALDEELAITRQTVKIRADEVETMKKLKESAVVNGAAVVQSQANLYSAEVSIPDLMQQIHETENALSVLLGRGPGTISRGTLSSQTPYADLKTGVPSQVLKNRPDVQQAELSFRKAFEQVNVARTAFYPSLTLTADGGLSAYKLKDFFDNSLFFSLAGGLTQPLFNQGKNKANLKIAKAQQQEAFYTYQQTLLTAGQEVSNALYAYQMAEQKEGTRKQQLEALEKAVDFTNELLRYSSATNYTDVLTSEQSLLSAQLSSVSDKLQKLQAVVNLYKALGGGWK